MTKHKIQFSCKHKFGEIILSVELGEDLKKKAEDKIKGGAWCENRCATCKLKTTVK